MPTVVHELEKFIKESEMKWYMNAPVQWMRKVVKLIKTCKAVKIQRAWREYRKRTCRDLLCQTKLDDHVIERIIEKL
jgi:hypothetical protein